MEVSKFGRIFKIKFWSNEILPGLVGLDTETEFITDPSIVPRLVLSTAYSTGDIVYVIKNTDLSRFFLLHDNFVFWNAGFDISVFENRNLNFHSSLINNKIYDGAILYRLLSIALTGTEAKKYNLSLASETILGEALSKDSDVRLGFGQFIKEQEIGYTVDYDSIPLEYYQYAVLDAIATKLATDKLFLQIDKLPTQTKLAHNINLLGDIALNKVHRNGICLNLPYVEEIKARFEDMKQKNKEILASYGYERGKKGNTLVFENFVKTQGIILPITESGRLSSKKEYLQQYDNFPFIKAYNEFKGFEKQANFLKAMNAPRIHPRYSSIKKTSRTSSHNPNMQNMPRIGGIRECFVPKEGHVFLDCDYSMIELVAISSINLRLFKESKMAELLNRGDDLHKYMASKINKVPESEVTKEQRQFAKIPNFGLVANMGIPTFIHHAATNGYIITEEFAKEVKNAFTIAYPEMKKYWSRGYGRTQVITDTGFIRSNCSYTEYLNCPMQTKVIEGAKLALYFLMREGYNVVAFIHDQVLVEYPIEGAEKALEDVKRIMIQAMEKVIVGVKVNVSGEIKTKFSK